MDNLDHLRGMSWRDMGEILHENFLESMDMKFDSPEHFHFLALALAGEAGELANIAKKDWRGHKNDTLDKDAISEELADIMIYLQILADHFDVNLEVSCYDKMLKNAERWPEMFRRTR